MLYAILNNDEFPLKLWQCNQTRWLSIETAVNRILDQWLELKTHFNVTRLEERCYNAELLHSMFCDNTNYLYLLF
jgi:hypothetical protein